MRRFFGRRFFGYVPGWLALILVLGGTAVATAPVFNGMTCFTGTGAASQCSKAPVAVSQEITSPSGIQQNVYNIVSGLGNNATFEGISGGYYSAQDDASVTSGTKGVLYGLQLDIRPLLTRNNSPYDDADDLVLDNSGTGMGTESIYFAHNASLNPDFQAALGIDMWARNAIYLTGQYTYGITFVHGTASSFQNGGGEFLVPAPAASASPIPIISVGSDSFTPSNNKSMLSVDSSQNAIFGTVVSPSEGLEHVGVGSNVSEATSAATNIDASGSLYVYNGGSNHIKLGDSACNFGINLDGSHNLRFSAGTGCGQVNLSGEKIIGGATNLCSSSSGLPCAASNGCTLSAATSCTMTNTVPSSAHCVVQGDGSDTTTGEEWFKSSLSTNTLTVTANVSSSQSTSVHVNLVCS